MEFNNVATARAFQFRAAPQTDGTDGAHAVNPAGSPPPPYGVVDDSDFDPDMTTVLRSPRVVDLRETHDPGAPPAQPSPAHRSPAQPSPAQPRPAQPRPAQPRLDRPMPPQEAIAQAMRAVARPTGITTDTVPSLGEEIDALSAILTSARSSRLPTDDRLARLIAQGLIGSGEVTAEFEARTHQTVPTANPTVPAAAPRSAPPQPQTGLQNPKYTQAATSAVAAEERWGETKWDAFVADQSGELGPSIDLRDASDSALNRSGPVRSLKSVRPTRPELLTAFDEPPAISALRSEGRCDRPSRTEAIRPYDQSLEDQFFEGPPHIEEMPERRRVGTARRPEAYSELPAVVFAEQPGDLAARLAEDLTAEGAVIVESSEWMVRAIIPPAIARRRGLSRFRKTQTPRRSNETISVRLRPCTQGTTAVVSGTGARLRSVVACALGTETVSYGDVRR